MGSPLLAMPLIVTVTSSPALNDFAVIPEIHQRGRSVPFAQPMHDVALVILGVKL